MGTLQFPSHNGLGFQVQKLIMTDLKVGKNFSHILVWAFSPEPPKYLQNLKSNVKKAFIFYLTLVGIPIQVDIVHLRTVGFYLTFTLLNRSFTFKHDKSYLLMVPKNLKKMRETD